MAEGTDHHEIEKLRPFTESTKALAAAQVLESEDTSKKWRIILEPALIGAMMAINLAQTSLQNVYLRTACTVDLGLPKNICDSGVGEEFRLAEESSQIVVSSINISRSFVGCLISAVVLLFVGPWSDCSGRRKPLLIMPLAGMCIMTTAVLILLFFPGASTVHTLYAVQIPMSLGGNFGLLLAAAFSHIGDVCHKTGRDVTRTMGTHRAAIQIAQVIGAVSGPMLYRHFGFYCVFFVSLTLQASSLIYVIVVVKDVNVNNNNKTSMLDWRLPFSAVQCLMRPRQGQRRKIIFLMLIVALGDRVMLSAEVLLSYMFYRKKFEWDDILFGSFLAYRNIISFVGTLLILTVLKRVMRLSDECVGMLSCTSYVLNISGLMAAQRTVIVFILPLIGIISQGSQVVQRPILNRQILPEEQGKIYSVMGALESATQTISSPLYSLLYTKTVASNPDAWLVPGMTLALLQLSAYMWTKHLRKKTVYEDKSIKITEMQNLDKVKAKSADLEKNDDEEKALNDKAENKV